MTPTVLVLIALAAGEAFALVKVRMQNKRLAELERKTEGGNQDVESAQDGGGLWNNITYLCNIRPCDILIY